MVASILVVVLDACVLIPAALRDSLLRAAEYELYQLRCSRHILEEVERNLVEIKLTDALGARRLVTAIHEEFSDTFVTGYEPLIDSMTNDAGDRHILAAAVASGADVIVTHNLRHFRDEDLYPYNVEAWSPDRFLCDLLGLHPATMMRIMREQASDLRRVPRSPEYVLAKLATDAPTFVTLVRRHPAWKQ